MWAYVIVTRYGSVLIFSIIINYELFGSAGEIYSFEMT